jgi:hypothetical protein
MTEPEIDWQGRHARLLETAERQATTAREQAERIRELIGDRDKAQSQTEAAYDLAAQYARKAGHDIDRDDVLRYIEQYWAMRSGFEKRTTELETFHWDVHLIATELTQGMQAGRAGDVSGAELAAKIVARIKAISPYGGRQKAAELFPRPTPPAAQTLLEEAS